MQVLGGHCILMLVSTAQQQGTSTLSLAGRHWVIRNTLNQKIAEVPHGSSGELNCLRLDRAEAIDPMPVLLRRPSRALPHP